MNRVTEQDCLQAASEVLQQTSDELERLLTKSVSLPALNQQDRATAVMACRTGKDRRAWECRDKVAGVKSSGIFELPGFAVRSTLEFA